MDEEPKKKVMAPNPADWKNKPMSDYSPLHRICSYLAMFPPNIAGYFINRFTRENETVFDPFCGRGTTPLESVLQHRKAIASDLNPLAVRLTKGKTLSPRGIEGMIVVMERIRKLQTEFDRVKQNYQAKARKIHDDQELGEMVGVVFSVNVLTQLLFLKEKLIKNREYDSEQIECDDFIVALILGAMHGQTDSYFSVSMPNTFSMSPNYIKKYVSENKLNYQDRNVFNILRERAAVALSFMEERTHDAEILECDATTVGDKFKEKSVNLLFSSPPYLKVIKYGLFNWIRLWFLDVEHIQVDNKLSDNLAIDEYVIFMKNVMESVEPIMAEHGVVCWVIGDVKNGPSTINLAEKVWEKSIDQTKWEKFVFEDNETGIIIDSIAPSKKVTRIWNSGGHYIRHINDNDFIEEVGTQNEAQEKLDEYGEGFYSEPVGTSGQATPHDRILMLKRIGSKPFDSRATKVSKKRTKPNEDRSVDITTEYFQWVISLDETEKVRYLRRFNKIDLCKSILKKLELTWDKNDFSSGSTVKTHVMKKIHEKLHFKIHGNYPNSQPLKKHDLLESSMRLVKKELDKEVDVSTSSTITKIGLLRLLNGIEESLM